ncbi:CYFA0S09e02509g1_1 [Cyberlindnera fabianii]|uniref:CYFA0S09e02509g1_1 n=1 Tax=Cyberlindnera fabianii TaxID=36022 RepID=A0A061AYS7_CYBFA|nr:hypothetical protein BON22_2665 [Cyberlindnera fabianii]CDR42387.1 CYFA0S09e02509g1_1 [Cyberlindnera fabianii]
MSTHPSPDTPVSTRTTTNQSPNTKDEVFTPSTRRLSDGSDRTSTTDITIPSSRDTSLNAGTAPINSTANYETSQRFNRNHNRESSLLSHLALDEAEVRAWQAVASPPATPVRPRLAQPRSVPAYCFPSLRGKLPTPVTTPTIEFEDRIQELERPMVRREQSEVRYSIYVNDADFEQPKNGWIKKLRHNRGGSIGELFSFTKKQNAHKPTKSASEVVGTEWWK